MKGIKYALAFLSGAAFASLWWGFSIMFSLYGLQGDDNLTSLLLLPIIPSTIVLILTVIFYLVNHWKDN